MDVRHEEKIWGKKFKVEPSGNETATRRSATSSRSGVPRRAAGGGPGHEGARVVAGVQGALAEPCQDGEAVHCRAGVVGGRVERVFSAAGKMHDDLKKSSKDDTLEASLVAMKNTD